MNDAFALAGRASSLHHPQGVALGYELLPLQGEALNTEAQSHGEYILSCLKIQRVCILSFLKIQRVCILSFLKIQRIQKLRGSVTLCLLILRREGAPLISQPWVPHLE